MTAMSTTTAADRTPLDPRPVAEQFARCYPFSLVQPIATEFDTLARSRGYAPWHRPPASWQARDEPEAQANQLSRRAYYIERGALLLRFQRRSVSAQLLSHRRRLGKAA
jgi:hypothetical protein